MDPFKTAAYEAVARIAAALGSPRRLVLLDLLAQGPLTVEILASEADLGVANASQHLQRLRAAGLVSTQRDGNHVRYALAADSVNAILVALHRTAVERSADLQKLRAEHLGSVDDELDGESLVAEVAAGEVTAIDVRPVREFAAGHLPGALSFPIDELEERFAEIPRDRPVVAYCRGAYCAWAGRAVDLLIEAGYDARSVSTGVSEWRADGVRL
jgi:rhodanese-related sulfurtransferase